MQTLDDSFESPTPSSTDRRQFLQGTAAALSVAAPLSWLAGAEVASARTPPAPPREPFDYARLKGEARTLANAPYQPPTLKLPPTVEKLDWDHWQAIRFRDERSLWAGEGLRVQVRFFHLGFSIRKPVRLFSVDGGFAQELLYDPAMFDYGNSGLRGNDVPSNLGFA